MSRQGKLVKNTLLLSLGTLFPRIANIITLPLLTAYLTKAEYGTYDLITVLAALYLPAVTLQIQTAAFRFLVEERDNGEEAKSIVTNIYAFTIPTSVAGLILLMFFLPGSTGIKLFICLYFAVDILVNTSRQIARGFQKNIVYSICTITASFSNMLLDVVFVWWLRMGLPGAVLALIISSALSLTVVFIGLHLSRYISFSRISWQKMKMLIRYSWPMVPNNMSMWVMRLSDRLVVTAVMGVAANAVYVVANKIPNLLNVAQAAFTYAWQENASLVSKDEDADAYYSSMFRTMFDLMSGFLGLLICATPLLFRLLIRGDYSEAYNQMPILFLAALFYSMATFLGGVYVAYMRTKSVGITTAVAAGINLVTDVATIRWIGLYAASGSTLVSYIFLVVFRMFNLRRIVLIKYDYKHIILIILILLAESALCFLHTTVTDCINIALGLTVFVCLNRELINASVNKALEIVREKRRGNSAR